MRILVTGAGGMVGRNILEHPRFQGHTLLAPRRQELDLFDFAATSAWMREHAPDIVIHCAGRVGGIQANIKAPVEFLVENTDLGRNVILAAHAAGVTKLINMGSSCMYPRAAENPLREELVLQGELEPTNEGYALAKIYAQRLCSYLNRQYGRAYKTLIPCNLYGRHDKFDPAHSHLVPAIIHKLHVAKTESRAEVDIWGTGEARREFMDAADVADFVATALERFDQLPEVINVGLGDDHSVNDYYRIAAEVIGYEGRFVHDTAKPVGMARKLVSVERLRAFGWTAPTSLEQGLRRTYDYYLSLGSGGK